MMRRSPTVTTRRRWRQAVASCAWRPPYGPQLAPHGTTPASIGAALGGDIGPPSSGVASSGAVGGAAGIHRQRWHRRRRRSKMARDVNKKADYTDNFPKPDPLVLERGASVGAPAWVDPMPNAGGAFRLTHHVPANGSTSTSRLLGEASLPDTHSPSMAAQWTTESPTLSPMQRLPHVTPPQGPTTLLLSEQGQPAAGARWRRPPNRKPMQLQ